MDHIRSHASLLPVRCREDNAGDHRCASLAAMGLVMCALAPSLALGANTFTLAVVPDTQQETVGDPTRFNDRMQWITDNKAALNIQMMLQVGDMMNWDTPDHIQYVRASAGIDILDAASVPYSMALGNHDTAAVKEGGSAAPGNVNTNLRNTSTYNTYFPTTRFSNLAGVYQAGKIDNACQTFTAGGLDWLVVNLELWPRAGAVDWAKTAVQSHPNHNVIIVTHSYLTSGSTIEQSNGGYGDNSPQYVFDNLVKQYANIRLVFCGHVGSHGYRTDTGVNGNTIYSFLQCYHDGATNPTRLIEIDTENGSIHSSVYCPYTDAYKTDGSTFNVSGVNWVPADGTPPPPPPPPPPASGPGSGILRETWLGIAGSSVAELTSDARYPDAPDSSELLGAFEGPIDAADAYGTRLRGYLIPPLSGEYVFWIAGDDEAKLSVSTAGEDPAAAAEICSMPGWTPSRDWTKYPAQESAPVTLAAGTRYYVEVLHKEGTGGDNVAVKWRLPSGASEAPIPGHRLDPWIVPEPHGPYSGAAHPLPGRIEAEEYDTGGEGLAWHDTTPDNGGGVFRSDDVDIQSCAEGGYDIGWTDAGEWLEYTASVAVAGFYDVRLRVAAPSSGSTVRVLFDGADATGAASIDATGDWQLWATVDVGGVELSAGMRVVRVVFDTGGFNLNWIELVASSEGDPPTDTDADGLPDAWELDRLGGLTSGAEDDPDGDGVMNIDEYLAGSDPSDAASYPADAMEAEGSSGFSCAPQSGPISPAGPIAVAVIALLYSFARLSTDSTQIRRLSSTRTQIRRLSSTSTCPPIPYNRKRSSPAS